MFIVTGASGNLGSRIVERLLTLVPANEIGISVRDISTAAEFADRGVRVRSGDFTDPTSLVTAFEGAHRVLVVSALIRGGSAVTANCTAIDAAYAAGAEHVLYTSHQAASGDSLFAPQVTHAETEHHLEQSGRSFTSLRNGFYVTTLEHYVGGAIESGKLVVPEDGPVSWTGHDDLAEAAAIALSTPGTLDGISAPLTAGELVDFTAVAQQLSEISGRLVERVVIGDDKWKSAGIERGMPAPAAEFALGMFRAARNGEFAVTDPTLESIIGHPASSVRSYLEQLTTR